MVESGGLQQVHNWDDNTNRPVYLGYKRKYGGNEERQPELKLKFNPGIIQSINTRIHFTSAE